MPSIIEIRITPALKDDDLSIRELIARELQCRPSEISEYRILRSSIDSRKRRPMYVYRIEVARINEKLEPEPTHYQLSILPSSRPTVLIVGAGPAGYFAALECIERGIKPIVIDRGKDVRERRRDLRNIQQHGIVDPDSNYCFGEGGAGTYSDGKLYTRANKRGNVRKVLQILVDHGATDQIMIDAHPHIGTNKLPNVVSNIRKTITDYGGEVRFGSKLVDFIIRDQQIVGGVLANGEEILADATILATGHSARDIFHLCQQKGIDIEFKPFAIGARIEHPQQLIDDIQYHGTPRGEVLPAASYSLVCQVQQRGVFSFCMCPGGLIVPASTAPEELVVNGMSPSKRDSPYANAGTVVSLDTNPSPGDPLGGMKYQQSLEQNFFRQGDGSQQAPAQRLTDFLKEKISSDLPSSSYIPGVFPARVDLLFPKWITHSLQQAILQYDKKMKGYLSSEAQIIGIESRTSSPVRINRDKTKLMSPSVDGLFPCGEGAGYAGGILSAALDGQRVVQQISIFLKVDS